MSSTSPISARYIDAVTVLVWAAENGHKQIVEYLLAQGVSVNAKDRAGRGNTALICASMVLDLPIVKVLIKAGADVNLGNDLWTPLMYAAWAADRRKRRQAHAVIKALLEEGANVNARDNAGQTAFCLAAAVGDVPILKTLVQAGAKVRTRDKVGNTALIGALQFHNFSTARFLLEQGVNINAKNKKGETALKYAQKWKSKEIETFLTRHGART